MSIHAEDERALSVAVYDVETTGEGVAETLDSLLVPLDAIGGSATHPSTGQDLAMTVWDVEYTDDTVGKLTGTIDFAVTGGAVAYTGVWTYDDSGYPARTVSCAE